MRGSGHGRSFHPCSSIALGPREVEDDLLGRIFRFLVDGAMRMEELVGEVAEDGGATRRDAALGNLMDEASEEFLDVLAVREVGGFGEKVGREILGVARRGWKSDGGVAQAEMMRAQAGL